MQISNKEIYQSAVIFIEQYGDAALLEAMKRQHELASKDDMERMVIWNRVVDTIEWIQMPGDLMPH